MPDSQHPKMSGSHFARQGCPANRFHSLFRGLVELFAVVVLSGNTPPAPAQTGSLSESNAAFNVEAATRAYLDRLPPEQRHRATQLSSPGTASLWAADCQRSCCPLRHLPRPPLARSDGPAIRACRCVRCLTRRLPRPFRRLQASLAPGAKSSSDGEVIEPVTP